MEKQNLYIFNFSLFLIKILILLTIIGIPINFIFEELIVFKSEINGAYKVNRILNMIEEDEIPIFGSSRAEVNFVPSIIDNRNCFNYGITGSQANIWLFFLEQELKKEKNTPIIINFDLDGLGYSNGDIANYIPNWHATKGMLELSGKFHYDYPFLKYFGQYEKHLNFFLNEKINPTKITDNGGSFLTNKWTLLRFQEIVNKRENSLSSFTVNDKLFEKFNALINSTDRTIVIVVAPYHKLYFNKFQNINNVDSFLKEIEIKENIKVIDLRHFIKKDNLFFDTTHLNYNGAKRFSKKLKSIMLQKRIIN